MAYSQADLDALDSALKKGARRVTYAGGNTVEFHSLDEMMRLRRFLSDQVQSSGGAGMATLAEFHRE